MFFCQELELQLTAAWLMLLLVGLLLLWPGQCALLHTLCISTKLTLTTKSVLLSASILVNISSMTLGITPWLSRSGDQEEPMVNVLPEPVCPAGQQLI